MKAVLRLTSYFFAQHMYTLVPKHVREDLEWMASIGTENVAIAILEQDLYASKWNMDIICKEAARVGMSVHAVISRWGGIVAGAPKVPSHFTATHPETLMRDKHGQPMYDVPQGPVSSYHHPALLEYFCVNVEKTLKGWPFKAIIWDEPKMVGALDYSEAALKALGKEGVANRDAQVDGAAKFFDSVGAHIRSISPETEIAMFMYAQLDGYEVERFAAIRNLDSFGCDGRPWRAEDGGQLEAPGKVLIGAGERFLKAAQRSGKKGLFLIENHNIPAEDIERMDLRLPEVKAMGADELIYYYYPRNVEDPDRAMRVIAKHLRKK